MTPATATAIPATSTTPVLDAEDRRLLNALQSDFPLEERPFQSLGLRLGLSETEVLRRCAALREAGLIRRLSAIFDARRLGHVSSLVAFEIAPDRLEAAAAALAACGAVGHCYAREGSPYNLWFTLTLPPGTPLDETVAALAARAGACRRHTFPSLRTFKIGVNFDMETGRSAASTLVAEADAEAPPVPVSDADVRAVRALQEDLELVPAPFEAPAARAGLAPAALLDAARDLARRGALRRFAAVLHHRKAGFAANAMSAWHVPETRSEEVGRILASHPAVSHAYRRPTWDDWPWGHFAMIHAASRGECEEVARELASRCGIADYRLLYSTREFRKVRVRLFPEAGKGRAS